MGGDMPTERMTTEVLVVGGGGTGLTASMLLSRLGVDHLLVSALARTGPGACPSLLTTPT